MSVKSNFLTDPPKKTSDVFVGRDEVIEKIIAALQHDSPMCLHGIGGIGKTAVCRGIFWKLSDCTDGAIKHLAWIKYNINLQHSFHEKFIEFNPNGRASGINADTYFTMVKNRINEYKKDMLLIIDDANEISNEEMNIVSSFACCVILTSRKKIDGMKCVKIGCIESEDDCVKMYKSYRGTEDDDSDEDERAIREMVRLSGHHTITIELLGKLQTAGFLSAQELLMKIENKGFTLDDNVVVDEKTIKEHLSIIFDISKITNENEMKLLGTMSILEPNIPININLIRELLGEFDVNAVNRLCTASWLGRTGKAVSIHPVISDVVRDKLTDVNAIEGTAEKLAAMAKQAAEDNEPLKMNELMPHCQAVLRHFRGRGEIKAGLLYGVGFMKLRLGTYGDAVNNLNDWAEIYRVLKGTSKETADAVHLLLIYQLTLEFYKQI